MNQRTVTWLACVAAGLLCADRPAAAAATADPVPASRPDDIVPRRPEPAPDTPGGPPRETATAPAAESAVAPPAGLPAETGRASFLDRLAGRLEVGARAYFYDLDSPSKKTLDTAGNVIGGYNERISLYKLDADSPQAPLPVIRYKPARWIAIEASYLSYSMTSETLDEPNLVNPNVIWDGHSDGDLDVDGPALSLLLRYPNDSRFTPWAGVGMAWLSSDFQEVSDFHENGLRNIEVDDTTARFFSIGCSIRLARRVQADVGYHRVTADLDAEYYMSRDGGVTTFNRTDWSMNFDNSGWTVGLVWAF